MPSDASEVVDPNREKDPWNKTPTEREVRSTRVPCSVAQAHGATAEDDSPDKSRHVDRVSPLSGAHDGPHGTSSRTRPPAQSKAQSVSQA